MSQAFQLLCVLLFKKRIDIKIASADIIDISILPFMENIWAKSK